jgi:hypothetical protein
MLTTGFTGVAGPGALMVSLLPNEIYSMAGGSQRQWKNHVNYYAIAA